jgi:hypothetical protein
MIKRPNPPAIPLILLFTLLAVTQARSQKNYIHTKEGTIIMNRKQLIASCLQGLHKDETDSLAVSICKCQVDQFDRHFTYKQYKKHMIDGSIDLQALVKEDSLLDKSIQECYTGTGKTVLLQAEGFEEQFMASCKQSILKSTEKKLDPDRLTAFCTCQLQMVKARKLSDAEMLTLSNPNSLLFYDVMYECGNPFDTKEDKAKEWNEKSTQDIAGPAVDTITILTLDGMTYVKVRLGSQVQVWLFDTGATDLLINTETEAALKKENVITAAGYLGIGEYEMADGMIDTCRRYLVSDLRIGQFSVNNVVVAVTEKGKKIIVGKALLNKFSSWMLNNSNNTLILRK